MNRRSFLQRLFAFASAAVGAIRFARADSTPAKYQWPGPGPILTGPHTLTLPVAGGAPLEIGGDERLEIDGVEIPPRHYAYCTPRKHGWKIEVSAQKRKSQFVQSYWISTKLLFVRKKPGN